MTDQKCCTITCILYAFDLQCEYIIKFAAFAITLIINTISYNSEVHQAPTFNIIYIYIYILSAPTTRRTDNMIQIYTLLDATLWTTISSHVQQPKSINFEQNPPQLSSRYNKGGRDLYNVRMSPKFSHLTKPEAAIGPIIVHNLRTIQSQHLLLAASGF